MERHESPRGRSPLTLPAGRVAKWVVIAVWLVVAAVAGPFAGQLNSVQRNDDASFLPRDAESTRALELQQRFPGGDTLPVLIVYERPDGLTPADAQAANAEILGLVERYTPEEIKRALAQTGGTGGQGQPAEPPAGQDQGGRQPGGREQGQQQPGGGQPPQLVEPSEDGKALLGVVPLGASGEGDGEGLLDTVEAIRAEVGERDDGLTVKVTGPGGFLADFLEVFGQIDSTLLVTTMLVVAVLLVLIYRSPALPVLALLVVGIALATAMAAVYGLVKGIDLTVNGQSNGILLVLTVGAGTDYALLLIARYREELRRHEDKHAAMAAALRGAGPAVIASASTVTIGLLCLLVADLNSNRGLGPVGAVGIVAALVAMMTLLPAVLVVFGRRVFWPFVPELGSASREESGLWARVGQRVARRPRATWLVTTAGLAVLALGLLTLDTNLRGVDSFVGEPESVVGQEIIQAHFPADSGQPAVVVAKADRAPAVVVAARSVAGVTDATVTGQVDDLARIEVTLDTEPDSQAERDTVDRLRDAVHGVREADALVGGAGAQSLDLARTSIRDRNVVIPLVLLVVMVILGVLLRAVVAPLVLIATVVVSFAAALGFSAVIFDRVFGFAGSDASLPLFAFIFLVALGIDYNIFLMGRVREETVVHGTHAGTLKGLAVTGGVITSAGVVLAATFSVLAVLPLVPLVQVSFVVAFGVLLDTLIVRSVLVPALTLDLDHRIWWPSALDRGRRRPPDATPPPRSGTEAGAPGTAPQPAGQGQRDASEPGGPDRDPPG